MSSTRSSLVSSTIDDCSSTVSVSADAVLTYRKVVKTKHTVIEILFLTSFFPTGLPLVALSLG